MGTKFSEGAIVQHLAKLRNKLDTDGILPVPPPLKRGSVTKPTSSTYKSTPKKRKANDFEETMQAVNKNNIAKPKGRKMKREFDADGDDDDSDYGAGNKKKKKTKKSKKTIVKQEADTAAPTPTSVKEQVEEESGAPGSATPSPGMHTRGLKFDYANMAGNSSEYEDSGLEEYEFAEADDLVPKSSARKSPPSSKIASPKAKVVEKTPVKVPQAPALGNNSGAAFMPAIGSSFTGFNNFNQVCSILFVNT